MKHDVITAAETMLAPPAQEWLVDRWQLDLHRSRSDMADCRRKRLNIMAKFYQRQAIAFYLNLRQARKWEYCA